MASSRGDEFDIHRPNCKVFLSALIVILARQKQHRNPGLVTLSCTVSSRTYSGINAAPGDFSTTIDQRFGY